MNTLPVELIIQIIANFEDRNDLKNLRLSNAWVNAVCVNSRNAKQIKRNFKQNASKALEALFPETNGNFEQVDFYIIFTKFELFKMIIPYIKNIQDSYGDTALHYASKYGKIEISKMLITAGANIDIQNDNGNTSLHLVTCHEITKLLIAAGAQLDIQNNDGWTPLHWSAYFGEIEITKLLIEAEANLDIQNNNGYTALHYAVAYTETRQMLIKAGANVNIQNNRNTSWF